MNLFEESFLLQLMLLFHFELVIEHYSVEDSLTCHAVLTENLDTHSGQNLFNKWISMSDCLN